MIKLLTIITQMLTVSATVLTHLAILWTDVGRGLNPYIALPIATLCMVLPYVIDHFFIEIVPDDDYVSTITVNPEAYKKPNKPIDSGSSDFPKDVF